MRLKNLKLKNFKRFRDFQAQFSPGINVVKGPLNEVGKSTLLEGIIAALFYNPWSTPEKLSQYISWGAGERCEIALEFEEEGNGYYLEKDFEKRRVKLINLDTGEKFDTFKKVSERLKRLIGTESAALFSWTSCIRQDQVREISSRKKEIRQSLEEVVSGGQSILASKAVQKLDEKISELKKGLKAPSKYPGLLASLERRISELRQHQEEIDHEVPRIESLKVEQVGIAEQLTDIEKKYNLAKSLLEKNKRRRQIEESIQRYQQRFDELEMKLGEIEELSSKSERAEQALKSIEGLKTKEQVLGLRNELNKLEDELGAIDRDLVKQGEKLKESRKELDKQKFHKSLSSPATITLAMIISLCSAIGAIFSLISVSGLFLGLVLLAVAMWSRSVLASKKTEISDTEKRIQRMEEVKGENLTKEKRLLAETKCDGIDEFRRKEAEFLYWLEEKERLDNQFKGKLGAKTVEEIKQEKAQAARSLAVEESNLTEDLKGIALGAEEYNKLEIEVESLNKERDQLGKRKIECEVTIRNARFDREDQLQMEEELENVQHSLELEERKLKIYELTKECISRAITEVISPAPEVLQEQIQKNLAIFTNDKYRHVKAVGALDFVMYSEEKDDWVKPEELSSGAIDEFYLACRLALLKLIFGERRPPLMLDDPFINFDQVRLARTLAFFEQLANDYQIIIFTLRDSYDGMANNIIRLGIPHDLS